MTDTRTYADRQLELLVGGQGGIKGTPTITMVDVTDEPIELCAANAERVTLLLINTEAGGGAGVTLGLDDEVADGAGVPLAAGGMFEDDTTLIAWWAVAPTGLTAQICVLEVTAL